VPVSGVATGAALGVVAPAAADLRVLGRPPVAAVAVGRSVRRLAALTGMFDVLWVVVVVLMILRPGSTTGVCR
jgi:hypothetical protein